MKVIKFVIAISILMFIKTAPAQLLTSSQHGTNCMSANLAQGGLLSWNRDGLTNNFISPLYVICPVPLEHSAIIAGATDFILDVDWYLPPTYAENDGPLCVFRVTQTGFGNPNQNFFQNIANRAFFSANGNLGFFATNRFEVAINFNTNPLNFDSLISGHLLCLVPPSADLLSYSTTWN